ncbi:MAG: hypothetical protein GOU98_01450 [Candidatus Altiarchaeota archaeon]|nr:hypothetical protein [Candidatus Altiarchaeota archaeon]
MDPVLFKKFLIGVVFSILIIMALSRVVIFSGTLVYHDKGFSCEHYCLNGSFGCRNINALNSSNITNLIGENLTYFGLQKLSYSRMDLLCGTETIKVALLD